MTAPVLAPIDLYSHHRPGTADENSDSKYRRLGGEDYCGERSPGAWTCTRPKDHPGQHIAHAGGTGTTVLEVWVPGASLREGYTPDQEQAYALVLATVVGAAPATPTLIYDPLCEVRGGDNTPEGADAPLGEKCNDTHNPFGMFHCTRPEGHPGQHIAGTGVGGDLPAVWLDKTHGHYRNGGRGGMSRPEYDALIAAQFTATPIPATIEVDAPRDLIDRDGDWWLYLGEFEHPDRPDEGVQPQYAMAEDRARARENEEYRERQRGRKTDAAAGGAGYDMRTAESIRESYAPVRESENVRKITVPNPALTAQTPAAIDPADVPEDPLSEVRPGGTCKDAIESEAQDRCPEHYRHENSCTRTKGHPGQHVAAETGGQRRGRVRRVWIKVPGGRVTAISTDSSGAQEDAYDKAMTEAGYPPKGFPENAVPELEELPPLAADDATDEEKAAAYEARKTAAEAQVKRLDDWLESFKRAVRREVVGGRERGGWCESGTNDVLRHLELDMLRYDRVATVTVTVTVSGSASNDAAATLAKNTIKRATGDLGHERVTVDEVMCTRDHVRQGQMDEF